MQHAVHRLDETSHPAVVAHFLALSATDRRLRFGKTLAADGIAAYVDGISLERDAVFAVRDAQCTLIGVVHVAMRDGESELGLSVLAPYRRRGIGGALFDRAVWHARNVSASHVLMYCAADNIAVVRLAHKFGMDIVARDGEAVARLDVRPAFAGPVAFECEGWSIGT